METEQNNLSDKGTLKLILDNKSQYVQQQAPQVQQYYGQTQNQPLNMLQNYGQQQSYYPYSGYNYSSFYGQQNYQQTQPQSQQQPQQYPYQQQQQQPQQYPYQQLQQPQQPYQYQQQQQQQSQPQANYYQNPMFNYNFYQQQPQNVINVSKESHISQAVQQQYQSKIIEDEEPDIEGPSRWSEEIKIYAHLYRRLQIAIPNVISAQFCKGRQIYSQQSLISVKQYVERAFEKCQSDYERSQMELYVKQTLEDSKKRNEYYSRDWARFPIPKLPRETQQKVMFTQNIPPTIKFPYNNMAPSYSMLQDKINGSKFGTPSAPVASLPTIMANTKFTENMMSLYDVMKEKQIQNINIKKRPVSYNMDFMLLQANKQKTMVTTTTTQQIKAHQQYLRKNEEDDEGISDQKIIGSCQDLEKQYFRLTGLPDPCTIRPEAILKKSLDFIMGKWKEGEVEYDYIIGQFRSIRQDLMVQHIQNNFAVQVYEENARISLECGDFPRYETCWTMLSDLYEIVSHGEGKLLSNVGKKTEFDSYRIVYLTMLGKQDKLVIIMNQQDNDDDEQIKLALEIRSAYQTGNYVKLFQLYKISSETMESLINQFLLRIRVKALKQFMRSFVGTLEVDYLAEVLAFQSVEHFKSFLGYFDQCKLDKEEKGVLIKESFTAFDVVNFDKIND